MDAVDFLREVLFRSVEDRTWIPERDSAEEMAILDMAELGWIEANPERVSGIGITERGMERYVNWGGRAAAYLV